MTEIGKQSENALSVNDGGIGLIDLLIVLVKRKKLILGFPAVVAAIAAGVSLLLPNVYTGTTKILPPQQGQSVTANLLAQLGPFAGLAALGGGMGGIRSPNELYIGMLMSRTVADNLIQRFDLNEYYDEKYQSGTRKKLEKMTAIKSGKDDIITIEVDDKDPKRAADMANAYVDELFKLTNVLAVTEASQRRLFFERQLAQARDNLAKAEVAARGALEKGGLVLVEGQGKAMLEATARLRAQITVKEVQIGAMRTFAAANNPDLVLAQQQLASMRRELARIEGNAGQKSHNAAEDDSSGLNSTELLRNVKYQEGVYELLAKQYEIAKIEEAKDTAVVQVMDKAIEPDRKSKPKRALIVGVAAFAALILAILWAFVMEALIRADSDPLQSERLRVFKRYLTWDRM